MDKGSPRAVVTTIQTQREPGARAVDGAKPEMGFPCPRSTLEAAHGPGLGAPAVLGPQAPQEHRPSPTSCLTGLHRPLSSSWGRKAGALLRELCTVDRGRHLPYSKQRALHLQASSRCSRPQHCPHPKGLRVDSPRLWPQGAEVPIRGMISVSPDSHPYLPMCGKALNSLTQGVWV